MADGDHVGLGWLSAGRDQGDLSAANYVLHSHPVDTATDQLGTLIVVITTGDNTPADARSELYHVFYEVTSGTLGVIGSSSISAIDRDTSGFTFNFNVSGSDIQVRMNGGEAAQVADVMVMGSAVEYATGGG